MKAIGASEGIGIGKAFILTNNEVKIDDYKTEDTQAELRKYRDSIEECVFQLEKIYDITLKKLGHEEAEIFKAHILIVKDDAFISEVEEMILNDNCNAIYAQNNVAAKYIKLFENFDDEYMKARSSDLIDINSRLISIMAGVNRINLKDLDEGTIIVADDLTPSDTAQLDKTKIAGIVTLQGGKTSHTAIMSRSMGIPAIVGFEGLKSIKNNDLIIVDGDNGELFINPVKDILSTYQEKAKHLNEGKVKLMTLKNAKSQTIDGAVIEICSNIGSIKDVSDVIEVGSDGVGLFRTEFLYMDRETLPSEQEQFEVYKNVLLKLENKGVVIRTLDIGGDKYLPYLKLDEELNPFLGKRAIRLCLSDSELFKTQLRALLRASIFGNLKIMFPMISSVNELTQSFDLLEECKQELQKEGQTYTDSIEVGMMIEVPSAAIMADVFAKKVDFFSIGTNDLLQYLTAVDRMNNNISDLYSYYHPALYRVIKTVIDAGHDNGIWVGMCGELASERKVIPLLLAMGLDEFSMSSSSVLTTREIINSTNKSELDQIVEDVLAMESASEVEQYLDLLDRGKNNV